MAFRQHHRWRLKPHFQPGDPCYSDRDASHTVTTLPEELKGKKLMQIVTMQVPREEGRRRAGGGVSGYSRVGGVLGELLKKNENDMCVASRLDFLHHLDESGTPNSPHQYESAPTYPHVPSYNHHANIPRFYPV